MFPQKADDFVAVDVNPRLFAQSVMPAGDFCLVVFDVVIAQGAHHVARQIDRERQIVKRVNIALRARR